MPQLNPEIADEVPWSDAITPYDEAHFVTYLRLLDAEANGADCLCAYRNPDRKELDQVVHHRAGCSDFEAGPRDVLFRASIKACSRRPTLPKVPIAA